MCCTLVCLAMLSDRKRAHSPLAPDPMLLDAPVGAADQAALPACASAHPPAAAGPAAVAGAGGRRAALLPGGWHSPAPAAAGGGEDAEATAGAPPPAKKPAAVRSLCVRQLRPSALSTLQARAVKPSITLKVRCLCCCCLLPGLCAAAAVAVRCRTCPSRARQCRARARCWPRRLHLRSCLRWATTGAGRAAGARGGAAGRCRGLAAVCLCLSACALAPVRCSSGQFVRVFGPSQNGGAARLAQALHAGSVYVLTGFTLQKASRGLFTPFDGACLLLALPAAPLGQQIVLLGDLNIDLIRDGSRLQQLAAALAPWSLHPISTGPTTDAGTCLDHVWTNAAAATADTTESHFSFHKPIWVRIDDW